MILSQSVSQSQLEHPRYVLLIILCHYLGYPSNSFIMIRIKLLSLIVTGTY